MQRKQNENELGTMFRRYGFHARKSRDRGYVSCPNCHQLVRTCPHCHRGMLLNKAETLPDFIVSWKYVYVEGKGATDRWEYATSISPTQYKVMADDGVEGWLFLEIGTGRAPNGREAYLVPWTDWMTIETKLREQGILSIVYERSQKGKSPSAHELMEVFQLVWLKGGWTIPKEHFFWQIHPDAAIVASLSDEYGHE
jgi:hypothetical protein